MSITQDHIRAMDQLRARLAQLSTSIAMLKGQLEANDPLPAWPALQAASTTLGAHMGEVASALNAQRQLFTSLHAYPMSTFPGVTQEALLQQLLRKKLEPRAEAWIDNTMTEAEGIAVNGNGVSQESTSDEDMRGLWEWASATTAHKIGAMDEKGAFDDVYTLKERRNGIKHVKTGLRRNLEDDDDEGEDDTGEDGSKMEEDGMPKVEENAANGLDTFKPPMGLESLLKLQSGA